MRNRSSASFIAGDRHAFRHALLLCLAGSVLLTGWAWAQSPQPGYFYTSRFEETEWSSKGTSKRAEPITTRTWVSGDSSRVDFPDGTRELQRGDYLLTTDRGRTITHVSPSRKRYSITRLGALGSEIASDGGGVRMSDAKVDPPIIGNGDSLLGLATQHLRISRSARVTAKVLVFTSKIAIEEAQEWWTSEDAPSLPDPFGAYVRTAAGAFFLLDPAANTQFVASLSPTAGRLPLRWRSHTRTVDGKTESTADLQLEVTELARGTAPPGSFLVPAGFKLEKAK